jgi:hypothetical protein
MPDGCFFVGREHFRMPLAGRPMRLTARGWGDRIQEIGNKKEWERKRSLWTGNVTLHPITDAAVAVARSAMAAGARRPYRPNWPISACCFCGLVESFVTIA